MIDFEDFWNIYNKKKDRKKTLAKWKRLRQKEKEQIMEHLPDYIKSTPNVQYRKNPLTYLNGECWHDEVIFYEKAKTIEVNDHETIFEKFNKKYGTAS